MTSVLEQDFPADRFEVIVVNDSGSPLPPEDWQSSSQVKIINTSRRERSVARNTGAAVSRGKYLHFLDDDDWMREGALRGFYEHLQSSAAGWIYGDSQLVNRQGEFIIPFRPAFAGNCFIQLIAGEWIPLQASLILSEAFFSVGGFHPLLQATQDIDLSRRIALRWNFDKLDQYVAFIGMGVEDSRTDYAKAHVYSRLGRESILDEPGVLGRMLGSADSAFWKGRIVRAFITSAVWNLVNRKAFGALSRGCFAFLGFVVTLPSVASADYWKAILRSYESVAFLEGFAEANLPVTRREVKDPAASK